jgi:hypothetical protein
MLRFLPFLSSRSAQRFTAIWTILLSGSTIRSPVMLVPPCWYGSKSIVCRSWGQTTHLNLNPHQGTSFPDWDTCGSFQFLQHSPILTNFLILDTVRFASRMWVIIITISTGQVMSITVRGRGRQLLHDPPEKWYVTSQ